MDGGQKQSNGNERKPTDSTKFLRPNLQPNGFYQNSGCLGGDHRGGPRRSRSHSLMTPTEGGRRIIIITIIIIIITNYASLRVCRAAGDSEANGNGQESAAGGLGKYCPGLGLATAY